MKRFTICLLLILTASPAFAGWYSLGNGYYSNGSGNAYTYRNGCYYFSYVIQVTPAAPTPPAYTKNWRSAYFDYLTAKADYDSYNATVAATAPALVSRDIVRPTGFVSSYSSSTQFGYADRSVSQYNQRSRQVDWDLALGDYGRTEDHQTDNLATAHGLRGEMLKDLRLFELENERRANTQAAIARAGSTPSATSQRTEFKSTEQQQQDFPPLAASKAKAKATAPLDDLPPESIAMLTIVKSDCNSCHQGPKAAKGFDIFERLANEKDEAKFQADAKLIWDKVSLGEMPLERDRVTKHPESPERIKTFKDGLIGMGAKLPTAEAE